MSPERRAEIASMGGRAAQSTGKAHRFPAGTEADHGRRGAQAKKDRAAGVRVDVTAGE